jgi:hypothetical protein
LTRRDDLVVALNVARPVVRLARVCVRVRCGDLVTVEAKGGSLNQGGTAWRKFFRICEPHHTVMPLPGASLDAACIVISMPLEKT